MGLRSGLASQWGMAAESAWGTYTAPTRFLEMTEDGLSLSIERIPSQALRSGRRFGRSDRWVAGAKNGGGPTGFEVADRGFGLPFKHMLGTAAITTPGGGTLTRDHTITPGDMDGVSATVQVGRPGTGGTVHPFSYTGCKVASWQLANSAGGLLTLQLTWDAQDETTAQALAVASYPAAQGLLSYVGGVITVAGSSFDVREVTIQGDNGLATDRHQVRANQLKKEQIPADFADVSGSIVADFDNLTAYNRFVNGTVATVTALWEGATIEGALKYGLLVTLPAVRFDGETPNVSGAEILTQNLPFVALDNGTDPVVSLRYRTTDVAS